MECAVIGPWHLGGSSVRDFLAGGRERRGGPSWPPGPTLHLGPANKRDESERVPAGNGRHTQTRILRKGLIKRDCRYLEKVYAKYKGEHC